MLSIYIWFDLISILLKWPFAVSCVFRHTHLLFTHAHWDAVLKLKATGARILQMLNRQTCNHGRWNVLMPQALASVREPHGRTAIILAGPVRRRWRLGLPTCWHVPQAHCHGDNGCHQPPTGPPVRIWTTHLGRAHRRLGEFEWKPSVVCECPLDHVISRPDAVSRTNRPNSINDAQHLSPLNAANATVVFAGFSVRLFGVAYWFVRLFYDVVIRASHFARFCIALWSEVKRTAKRAASWLQPRSGR